MSENKRIDIASQQAFEEAKRVIPGGVNSPVRAFKSVGLAPFFVEKAKGAVVSDIDGNDYIDYVGSWGPMIVGHAHPEVVETIMETAQKGTSFGAPTELETRMAKLVCERMPSIESVRMVNSGTEATMSALRLARGYTGRAKIIKFAGCYHGHADSLLIKAGSGVTTLGLPDSPGVPESVASGTITAPYNDLESVREAFAAFPEEIAAVIVEPIAGNMGVVPPAPGFLEGLRQLTSDNGALLIFDEVMTGFRVSPGGAQQLYGITPDLTCLGKIIGGGLPVGAYGGRRDLMEQMAPAGPIYQAGTLSGNPLAMAAGFKTLEILGRPGAYEQLEAKSAYLEQGLRQNAEEAGIASTINRVGSMICPFFTAIDVVDYTTAMQSDLSRFATYFRHMLELGVSVAPSQFEGMFLSLAHTDEQIDQTLSAHRAALKRL